MSVPSEMPIRQFPRPLRTQVRVAYAVAWEALVASHTEQALQFVGEFSRKALESVVGARAWHRFRASIL